MPSFAGLLLALLILALAAGAFLLWAGLRRGAASPAAQELGRGHFAAALAAARIAGPKPERDELYAAAVAAKHLLELDRAKGLLDRLLAADPGDGEAWLERGLVAAYEDDLDGAEQAFAQAAGHRSDLAESITLHRAWLALRRGDGATARRLFDEVEAPLETKLRTDLGADEPLFAEWFLQTAALWQAFGRPGEAAWARAAGRAAAPESRVWERIGSGRPDSATIESP
jgi:tetratricopeptide (TPR) repeat protein